MPLCPWRKEFSRTGQNRPAFSCAGRDGELRLVQGSSGPGYEYGRLEIFLRGFWSTICDTDGFTPDAAQVACSILGYDGGSSIQFRQPYSDAFRAENQVKHTAPLFCFSICNLACLC